MTFLISGVEKLSITITFWEILGLKKHVKHGPVNVVRGRRYRSKPPLHCKTILEEIIVSQYFYKCAVGKRFPYNKSLWNICTLNIILQRQTPDSTTQMQLYEVCVCLCGILIAI